MLTIDLVHSLHQTVRTLECSLAEQLVEKLYRRLNPSLPEEARVPRW
jgi:hypothetical protein